MKKSSYVLSFGALSYLLGHDGISEQRWMRNIFNTLVAGGKIGSLEYIKTHQTILTYSAFCTLIKAMFEAKEADRVIKQVFPEWVLQNIAVPLAHPLSHYMNLREFGEWAGVSKQYALQLVVEDELEAVSVPLPYNGQIVVGGARGEGRMSRLIFAGPPGTTKRPLKKARRQRRLFG